MNIGETRRTRACRALPFESVALAYPIGEFIRNDNAVLLRPEGEGVSIRMVFRNGELISPDVNAVEVQPITEISHEAVQGEMERLRQAFCDLERTVRKESRYHLTLAEIQCDVWRVGDVVMLYGKPIIKVVENPLGAKWKRGGRSYADSVAAVANAIGSYNFETVQKKCQKVA